MRAVRRRVVGVGVAVAMVVPGVAQAGTLDQQVSGPADVWMPVGGGARLAQTFTASLKGTLDGVELSLFTIGNPGPLTVEIRSVLSDGTPSSQVLATTTVPESAVTGDWIPVTISAPSATGTHYAIVLSAPGGNRCTPNIPQADQACYDWRKIHVQDLYAGGGAFATPTSAFVPANGAANGVAGSGDFLFRTFVKTCPEIAPTGSVAGLVYRLGGSLGQPVVQQLSCSLGI